MVVLKNISIRLIHIFLWDIHHLLLWSSVLRAVILASETKSQGIYLKPRD